MKIPVGNGMCYQNVLPVPKMCYHFGMFFLSKLHFYLEVAEFHFTQSTLL